MCLERELFAHQVEQLCECRDGRRDEAALDPRDRRLTCLRAGGELGLREAVALADIPEELSRVQRVSYIGSDVLRAETRPANDGRTLNRVSVRPFADGDSDPIGAVLDATYGHDPRLRALHEGGHGPPLEEPFRRSLVAEVKDEVVAAGTIFHGTRHPSRSWSTIAVAPRFRRQGIGTALLGELRSLAERPLCGRGLFAEAPAMAFLRRHGFGLLNRSWEGRFDPAAVVARQPEPGLGRPPSRDEAAAFFERWYQETHRWDPPAPWPLERAREFFCGDDLIPGSLVGVRADDRLIAAGSLIRPPAYDPGDELYLVWVGTLGRDDEAAADVVAACVRFALDAGKALRFEVDESNAAVWTALDRLGVLGEPVLGIFAEDAGSE
jgi:GNAT superfamily N-acetyltransferase